MTMPNQPKDLIPRMSWYLSRFARNLLALMMLAGLTTWVQAQLVQKPNEYEGTGVDEQLGEYIPLSLTFTDSSGEKVQLKQLFGRGKPVVLVMAYYECPMLCTLVLNGTTAALDAVDLEPGQDFTVVTVSIDPKETAALAAEKKKHYLRSMEREIPPADWRFLTGEPQAIESLSKALGFNYTYNAEQDQYVHAAVIHVLTDEGRISRYLYGIQFKPKDVKLAIVEASEGKVGSVIDRVLMYCFHYDPAGKEYRLQAMNVMRVGAAATVVLISLLLGVLWSREVLTRQGRRQTEDEPAHSSTNGNSGPSSSS